jgi:hypothetical protein
MQAENAKTWMNAHNDHMESIATFDNTDVFPCQNLFLIRLRFESNTTEK